MSYSGRYIRGERDREPARHPQPPRSYSVPSQSAIDATPAPRRGHHGMPAQHSNHWFDRQLKLVRIALVVGAFYLTIAVCTWLLSHH